MITGAVDRINGLLRRAPVWPCYVLGFAPAVIYLRLALQNRLGADPVKAFEHELGLLALQLLIAALTVSLLLAEFTGHSWIAGHAIARQPVTLYLPPGAQREQREQPDSLARA